MDQSFGFTSFIFCILDFCSFINSNEMFLFDKNENNIDYAIPKIQANDYSYFF